MAYGLEDKTTAAINAVFAHYPAIEKVVFYGSRAKGNARPASKM